MVLCAKDLTKSRFTDSLKGKIWNHLDNDQIDSALYETDLLYAVYLEEGNTTEIIRTKTQRAELLRTAASLDLALAELELLEDLLETTQSSTVKAFYYNRLAAIQFERQEKEAALKAVRISQEYEDLDSGAQWIVYSNFNILGAIYRDREEWGKSIEVLNKTIEAARKIDDKDEMYLALKNLGQMYYRKGDFREAIKAFHQYRSNDFIGLDRANISENYRLLGHSYRALNILDSAYIFLDSAHASTLEGMQEMVNNRTDDYRIAAELNKQKLENEILSTESEKSQLKIIILIVVLIFIISISGVFFKQKQSYKKLNAKQHELNKELELSLAFKNKLIAIVAHDIRNPMASLSGLLHLYNEGLVEKQDLKEMMAKLEASAVSVNFLIENLLNWVLNQKEALKSVSKPFNLSEAVDRTCLEVQSQLRAKDLSLQVYGFKSDELINSDESMLSLVIRNLLSNAIKFSTKGSEVIVSYAKDGSNHHIVIQDFGVGMTKLELENLAEEEVSSQFGTENEKGTGLGLAISKEFLKALGASFEINSEKGKGTEFIILLPLKS